MFDCIKKTYQWEGLKGFYKGCASPLIGQMVFNAVQFCVYGQIKKFLKGDKPYLTIPQYFEAGLFTGICVAYYLIYYRFVESPMDLFKSQMQYQIFEKQANPKSFNPEFKGVIDCCSKVVKHYGLRGFYQGLGPTIYRDMLAVCFYFGSYEWMRRKFLKPGQTYDDVDRIGMFRLFLSGGIAGIFYWLPIYPIDVVKSHIQIDSVHPEKRIYKGFFDCAKQLYKAQGMGVFFKAFVPCLIRSFPANAACFICYQESIRLLNQK